LIIKNKLKWPSWPSYPDKQVNAVKNVLASGQVNYWTGTEGRKFEQEFAAYIGAEHAIAVSNGSVALGVSLRALNLPSGAEVIVTPRTFVATVSEIILAGLRPVFADVDADSQNLTAETIAAVVTERTAAILVVHLAGWPCDMPEICALARKHGHVVIEDCAQAHGAAINGRKAGSWGDIAAFSFCQDKIMTTGGEGGMIVTNNEDLFQHCWSFKDHGKNHSMLTSSTSGTAFRWVHDSIGTNLRLTELQSAIGRIQLAGLDKTVAQRNRNAAVLFDRLEGVKGLRVPRPSDDYLHAFYKCYVFIIPDNISNGWSRDRILSEIVEHDIPCGSGICPEVYLEHAFTDLDLLQADPLPVAQRLGQTSLMFRVDPALNSEHMHKISDVLINVMGRACR
jgi:dTDP-4-amino-4,6-dideoxygalactose transaminase